MVQQPKIVDIDKAAIDGLLARTAERLSPEDHALVAGLVDTVATLMRMVRERGTTIARLRQLFGLRGSEKTADVLGEAGARGPGEAEATSGGVAAASESTGHNGPQPGGTGPVATNGGARRRKAKGHGRVGATDYVGAKHIPVTHQQLHVTQRCPLCARGSLFRLKEPARVLRIVGQEPLAAVCWDCEQLRCSACGEVFTAKAPPEAQGPKHAETAASMMVLLRYGVGVPLHRLAKLQRDFQTPVPVATQWEVALERSELVRPVFEELRRLAAQSNVVHNDDTTARILEFMGRRRAKLILKDELPDPDRTGIFTTAIVAKTAEGRCITLFSTSRKHAGENLGDVLGERAADLPAPILMCDALDRNVPPGRTVVESNCLAHGRRHVVDEVANFPTECAHLLRLLGEVFETDARCRTEGLDPEQRLRVHQRESRPLMDGLQKWMTTQLDERRVEPNSGLGQAIRYLLKRWDKLTLFLRVPGAPLENNICERALKYAIRHRNNSLFYKTQRGARVGDIWMSLIHTATVNGENPFQYLTALQLHAAAVAERPQDWLPWNYREALGSLGATQTPATHTDVPLAATPHQRPPPN